MSDPLRHFHPATAQWFASVFAAATKAQGAAWTHIAQGQSTLLVAPTGSGKTLAAFLHAIDQLLFVPDAPAVLYISPLKALAVDVEKNLRAPLHGIVLAANTLGATFRSPTIGVRTGDTSIKERAQIAKHGVDILITTPESLYLMLTSAAKSALTRVGLVIIDEIHALVPTKRGSHLMVSLERLERLRQDAGASPLVRIGLSATQRPLEEVAKFLGGATHIDGNVTPRPVAIADGKWAKQIHMTVDVPVEDMSKIVLQPNAGRASDSAAVEGPASIWNAIHPRLVELIRAHRTTLLFVNSRRLSERLAAAINEVAGELLVQAHHGSLAREQRTLMEDALKSGTIAGIVATSSLELGIDMGSIDLVIQIEAPPSVASGIQRVGRAGHSVGAPSTGIVFPKFRSDLLACAALVIAMNEGMVESTKYPRNPLDILCQQLVAIVSQQQCTADELFDWIRQAAPFAELTRQAFENCLDLMTGRYESDDFAELRPRLSYDRVTGIIKARPGAQRIAILNGGTIPDRGLYGVFLEGAAKGQGRVGELDEEMVFESKAGECFLLGASTWRITEITFDRVMVTPAPGQPGKMPFWRGENAARPLEFGQRIGALARKLQGMSANSAHSLLAKACGLNQHAADNLLRYLHEQADVSTVPDDKTIVIECARDELGDWRIALLSPLGGQVLAPWSIAMIALAKELRGVDIEASWANDGIVVRAPESMELGDLSWLVPDEESLETTLYAQLAKTSTFAARFREAAARALILTKRRPGMRTPLWQQRKKSTDLFASASRFPSFPILLEAYRELIGDIFDVAALKTVLRDIRSGAMTVKVVHNNAPSPFAASLLFGYAGQFLYDGDTPPNERKAQALAIDLTQLKDLLGALDLRELLDLDSIGNVEQVLQCVAADYQAKDEESLYDVLLKLGDLSAQDIAARSTDATSALQWVAALLAQRRVVWIRMANEERLVAIEYIGRYMGALGLPAPRGLVLAHVATSEDPLGDVLMRFARTHVPFAMAELAQRYGAAPWLEKITELVTAGKLLKGAFTPGRQGLEFSTPDVLSRIQRKAVMKLRAAVEPSPKEHYARALTHLQGLVHPRRGMDAILDVVEQLQGMPIIASLLETEVLRARVADYLPGDIDTLITSGEVVWVGVAAAGLRDGYVTLYLADHMATLRAPIVNASPLSEVEQRIVDVLATRGALFSNVIADALRPIFAPDLTAAIWSLVFRGYLTNDSLFPLRNFMNAGVKGKAQRAQPWNERGNSRSNRLFRSRRAAPSNAEGRWSLLPSATLENPTTHLHAKAESLLARYGLVTREVAEVEQIPGGFTALYNVYRTMEERGRLQRGYFVADIPAMQFAHGTSVELIRSMKKAPTEIEQLWLSAVDPGNPYGALLPWPVQSATNKVATGKPSRSVGAHVALANGHLLAWLSKSGKTLNTFLPDDDDAVKNRLARCLGGLLADYALGRLARREGLLVEEIDGQPPAQHPLLRTLQDFGFELAGDGLRFRNQRGATNRRGEAATLPHAPAAVGATTLIDDEAEPDRDNVALSLEDEIARELDEAGMA